MIIEAIVLSIMIGLFRGGKLRKFKALNQRTFWVLILGLVINYFIDFVSTSDDLSNLNIIMQYNRQINIFSYILIFIGIVANIRFKSMWAVLAGLALKIVSLSTNGWIMPNLVDNPSANVNFPILGQTIRFYEPYPIPQTLSLGDIIISFGIFALIQELMLGGKFGKSNYKF